MAVDLEPGKAGTWEDLADGSRLWRLKLESPNALWMVVGFDAFRMQDGGLLWVYDADRRTVLGPYGAADVRDHGELWSVPIEGDTMLVELYWPAKLRGEQPRVHLGTVSHGYKPFGSIGASEENALLGGSGACNIDVACPLGDDWQDQQRGVVILLSSGGSSFCTGSLINNTANDCKPYVLTAAHCSPGASTAYGFNFQRSACGSGNPPGPTTQMVSGGTVRANFASSDFSLVEMSALPPQSFDFYLNGWSRDPNPSTSSWVIHHPSGDFKKISLDSDPPVNGTNWGPNHWRIDDSNPDPAHLGYELGTTEPGSSGSPLFDQDHRITGQLHGGTASCSLDTWDEYGKVASSWTGGGATASRLSDWLDPLNTGVLGMDGRDGDLCFFNPAGSVSATRSSFACSDTVTIRVSDDSLQGNPTQAVTVSSNTETTPETVVLAETPAGSGDFQGTIAVASVAPVNGDGTLSVAHGDTITVTYIDADDGGGGTNVPRTTTASVDCVAPSISNVQSSLVTGNSARITWTTDEPSDSRVRYGTTPPPGATTFAAGLVTSHVVDLTGLAPCADYVFSVESADAVANATSDNNGGSYYAFTTGQNVNPNFPSSSPPVPIPDNNPDGASMSIVVPDNKTVLDVNVRVNITHTFDGDFVISLVPPVGAPITLSNRRGGSGDNYTNTVFDDEAATPISAGTAPFTGSFRPDSLLSAADGINAAGTWTLRVVDQASVDVGTIDNWTLSLTYPALACGPHANVSGHATVADTCSTGGGGGNGLWEAGETVQFTVTVENDGSTTLTGVSASITSPTPGVVILDGVASYPDLAPSGTSPSGAPHFTLEVPAAAACNADLGVNVQVNTDQGSWSGSFTHKVGQLLSGTLVALNENFAGGIPATWSVVDGGTGGGAAATWTTANPGARTFTAPMAAPVAMVDSDNATISATQNEELITPVLNLSGATSVTLEFDQFFRWFAGSQNEQGDVDVRSSLTGGAWVNVFKNQGASSPNPDHKTLNITAQAAGAADVQIRFHYYQANFEWWWMVDNVKVTAAVTPGCTNNVCAPSGPQAKPVNALDASRVDPTTIDVAWDVASCTSTDYEILYGNLSSLPSYTLLGSVCGIGTSGTTTWSGVPAGDLWFLVTGLDGVGTEASWGAATAGERNGGSASGQCGNAARDNGATCP
jgi:subtilisin-like proprotein convertase family protein